MTETITIANDELTVSVSAVGAETRSLTTADGREWMWNGDPEFWTGRAPILFPIVGKAPDDELTIAGKAYPMKQHGFARRATFTLAEKTRTACRFELNASDETRAVYPFDFLLSVTHALDGSKLTVSVTVENQGGTPMPFGFGFHPAFLWPMPGMDAGHVHHVTLENGAEPAMIRLRDGLLDLTPLPSPFEDGVLPLKHSDFAADAMVFPEGAGDRLTFSAEDGPALHFAFENLPNLALWTKVGAPYVCIEPWHGMAAAHGKGPALEDRPYTQTLAPGKSARFSWSVEVDG
ncbi:aldose 1-epimerase family protein [Martelella endophytica]|uniref:Aldose epimerase n=1 Tax=Martelella endophytica TaxID=1486262 RepID=A0A0D5LQQ9_MAREN|nr:aldose 1-epimerase family protein [Martelella endophytica]AJY45678.1 aldose epimerase [Martelella endophytica]